MEQSLGELLGVWLWLEMVLVARHHDVPEVQAGKHGHHENHSTVFRLRGLWVDHRVNRQARWALGALARVVLCLLNDPELLEAE